MAHGLSCSAACAIFPDQGLNPCFLHWQADSLPLSRQGRCACNFVFMFAFSSVPCDLPVITVIITAQPWGLALSHHFQIIACALFLSDASLLFVFICTEAGFHLAVSLPASAGDKYSHCGQAVSADRWRYEHITPEWKKV